MAAVFKVHLNRMVYSNPHVAGHCYFEAQAQSNPVAAGMPKNTGDRLMRLLCSYLYGGNMVDSLASAYLD
jgi:hypothetical protein